MKFGSKEKNASRFIGCSVRDRALFAGSCLLLILTCLLANIAALAQTTQQFTGHVFDSSGALMPDVEIVVHNPATGVDAKTITTSQGVYTVPYLAPGTYTITARKQGFKAEQKTNILLNVDQTSTIDFKLSVGSPSESVTVDASAVQIELTKSDRGLIIDSERVNEEPLDGRNVYGLVDLTPGEHNFANPKYLRPFDTVTNHQYIGGSPNTPVLSLDGISNDSGGNTSPAIVPSVDTVQEFKVVTNALDASYGRAGSTAVDMELKSGTNQFHGTLDYYQRAAWLDAYAWTNKWSALTNHQKPTKNPHHRDQWSLEFDGPVSIPHLYNGKNKLFFTVGYEEMLDTLPNLSYSYASIPNPDWLKGDFSTAQYWNTKTNSLMPLNIYDPLTPLTTVVDPHDGVSKSAHAQFPGNRIPTGRIDPVGAAMLSYLAEVKPNNDPGPGYAPYTNNWRWLGIENDIYRNALVKVNYVMSDKDRFSFHWSAQYRYSNYGALWPEQLIFGGFETNIAPKAETGAASWTHIFSPLLLFDLHATVISRISAYTRFGQNTEDMLEKLGFASAFSNLVQNKGHFPYISLGGFPNASGTTMGNSSAGSSGVTHALDFLPTITWVHGQHTTRAGFDVQLQQYGIPFGGTNDNFTFTNNFTNEFHNFSEAPGYSSGASYASALLGYMNSGAVYSNYQPFESQPYYAPWIQDDWKVTKNLTLNLGFRWDFQVAREERHNKMDGIFNTQVINPVSLQLPFTVMGGIEFAGINGQSRRVYAMNPYEWQPRVGFVYAIRPTISLRGGIGKFYMPDTSTNDAIGFSSSTSYVNSLDGGLTPYTATTGQGLSNPYPTVIQPTGSSLGYLTNLGQSYTFVNPHYHIAYEWSYNMELQAAVTKHDVVSIAYVGYTLPNYNQTDNLNHASASWFQQCNGEVQGWHSPLVTWNSGTNSNAPHHICDDNVAANTIGFETNPFASVAAYKGSGFYGVSRIATAYKTRPYYGWSDIYESGAYNKVHYYYNAFQAAVDHNVSHNLTLHFTYAHATDVETNYLLDTNYRTIGRSVSTSNQVKHSMTLSGVAYLPFGKGRPFFSNVNHWVDEAINGWEVSPLFTYYSGFHWRPSGTWEWNTSAPMGVHHKTLPSDGLHNYQRIRGVTPCVGYKNADTGAVTPSTAAVEAGCTSIPYVLATSYAMPRNVIDFGAIQPGAVRFDAAFAKNFSIPGTAKFLSENTKLQLRVDMLNVLNHPNWDTGYNNTSGADNWGTISKGPTGPTNNQRFLQLSARLNW